MSTSTMFAPRLAHIVSDTTLSGFLVLYVVFFMNCVREGMAMDGAPREVAAPPGGGPNGGSRRGPPAVSIVHDDRRVESPRGARSGSSRGARQDERLPPGKALG